MNLIMLAHLSIHFTFDGMIGALKAYDEELKLPPDERKFASEVASNFNVNKETLRFRAKKKIFYF